MHYQYFDERIIALQEEMGKHPDLQERLGNQTEKDPIVILNEVAAHCRIVLDGTYTDEELLVLCDKMTKMLYMKRTNLIVISPGVQKNG